MFNGFLLGLGIFCRKTTNSGMIMMVSLCFLLEEVGYLFFATPTSLEGGKNVYFE